MGCIQLKAFPGDIHFKVRFEKNKSMKLKVSGEKKKKMGFIAVIRMLCTAANISLGDQTFVL